MLPAGRPANAAEAAGGPNAAARRWPVFSELGSVQAPKVGVSASAAGSSERIPRAGIAASVVQSFRLSNLSLPNSSRSMNLTYLAPSVSSFAARLGASFSLAAILVLALPCCNGSDVTSAGGAGGGTDTCIVDDDCTFGEIDKDITMASECICLYGCVYLPVTKITAARRLQQHKKYCQAAFDGHGNPCGIDDCVVPGTVVCMAGTCQVSSTDPAQ